MQKTSLTDLICFSHLNWDFVYQRPQHLLTRFSKHYRVFYIEEPRFDSLNNNTFEVKQPEDNQNIWIVTPRLKSGLTQQKAETQQVSLLAKLFSQYEINAYIFWYYTPMAFEIGRHFKPAFTVYDCMDELSSFKFAPPALKQRELELFKKADIVFTGGHNLYKTKKTHTIIYILFPSSIDKKHFSQARLSLKEPKDQKDIPHPRFGFYGVIDERMDIELLKQVAQKKPDWHFVIIGPVVKIDPDTLPRMQNIHYLGGKTYKELPFYLAGWDVAIIPFVLNESTRHISPTKTPEYLSGGKPVISTSIIDVVNPYGENGLVHVADSADEFIKAAKSELKKADKTKWLQQVDEFLLENSWDNTWQKMMDLITTTMNKNRKSIITNLNKEAYV